MGKLTEYFIFLNSDTIALKHTFSYMNLSDIEKKIRTEYRKQLKKHIAKKAEPELFDIT